MDPSSGSAVLDLLVPVEQDSLDRSLVLGDPIDSFIPLPAIEDILPMANSTVPIPLPAPNDDHLPLASLVWGRNVPVIEKRDPRLCGQIVNLSG